MSITLPDPLLVLIVVVIFILIMRALLSWWLRTNEIVRELRTLNELQREQISELQQMRADLRRIAYNSTSKP